MSMINTPSDMAFLPEEDAATIGAGDVAAAIESGAVSATQPGLVAPAETPEPVVPPVDPYAAKRGYYVASSEVVVENGRKIQVVTDYNGRVTRTDIGAADAADEDEDADNGGSTTTNKFTPLKDARNTIRSVLQTYGLGNLADYLYDLYAKEEVNIENPDALLFAVRDTNEYKTRFAANARRAAKGLPELDPGSYLGLENQYRDLLRSNGLPIGFYDQTSDFEKLIEGDVSPSELQSRISNGYRQIADADPEVRRQMRELYNVDEAGLAAYFLDPERATPLLERQARAAQIAARSREQAGIQLGALSAEELAARGITPSAAQEQFARMGQLAGLYQEMGGEEALTEQEKIGAAFGYDVQAQQRLERRRAQRVGEFAGGGQFARTSGATSGTVETGAGLAQ